MKYIYANCYFGFKDFDRSDEESMVSYAYVRRQLSLFFKVFYGKQTELFVNLFHSGVFWGVWSGERDRGKLNTICTNISNYFKFSLLFLICCTL